MTERLRVAIIGRTEVLYDTALALNEAGYRIVCILTAKEAPEYKRTAADFEKLAQELGIQYRKGADIRAHVDLLQASKADIAVSINYPGIVPQSVIDLFPLGVLNAHGGDLPRYRGNACQAWAILNGEDRIGLCIHRMIGDELDSGDIIARDYLSIDLHTKITQVCIWMQQRIPDLICDALKLLSQTPDYYLEKQSKAPEDALRCYPRQPEDGRIDWQRSATDVLRLINASNKPYAGAFCYFGDDALIIWDAELASDSEIFCAVPGQITKVQKQFVEVACGSGKLRLKNVRFRGKDCRPYDFVTSTRNRLC